VSRDLRIWYHSGLAVGRSPLAVTRSGTTFEGVAVAASKAVYRRVQCRAVSRSGERCKRWCSPGHLTCVIHGGGSPQARRSARVREALAEVLAADPRRPMREIMADAVHVADLVMRDKIAELRDAESITPAAAAALTDAALRASALAKAAMDAGIDVEAEAPAEVGELVVSALSRVGSALLAAWHGPASDYRALESWVLRAVPCALRGGELPEAPRPWVPRRPVWPDRQIESPAVVRAAEAPLVSEALGGFEAARVPGAGGVAVVPGRRDAEPAGSVRERERAYLRSVGRLPAFGGAPLTGRLRRQRDG
jgi:hypothetical protein